MNLLASLIIAHFVGDYLLQNDYIAQHKVRPAEGNKTRALLVCLLHCALYTATVALMGLGALHWSMLVLCFGAHLAIDHFRLARKYMALAGQDGFASGVFSPWSIIVVDNTFHILTIWVMVLLQERLGLGGML
jgi:hypothetical protein